ncbi:MAG: D-tyrosyl-tRNA(Tyr) deacylase [Myxococcales bacterium]|nr:D-tyrosyl-tRNA(Tyr) deacylase [Myxococcales bacterium]
MRAVVQRVSSVRVRVGDELVGEMGAGLLALVGVGREDRAPAAAELARKLVHLRLFQDDNDRMNLSLLDTGGTLGVVSQFTLFGDVRGGRRPSYLEAAPAEQAAPLVEAVVTVARDLGVTVITGRFQSMMQVELVNEGPVTLLLDTDKHF